MTQHKYNISEISINFHIFHPNLKISAYSYIRLNLNNRLFKSYMIM